MKPLVLLLCLSGAFFTGKAQTKALTETGKEVILFDDGTWKYQDSSGSVRTDSLIINPQSFSRSSDQTFPVKSNAMTAGVYINPSKWVFAPHKDNEVIPEYRFNMRNQEGYAMMITEKTPIELADFRDIALINARKASMDARETGAEYRMVNGNKVLCLKIEGTIKGIKFVYLGYYYSDESGSLQLVAYTSRQLFAGVQADLEKFLNGLVETKK